MNVLVAGFGPFGEVVDNPSSRLAMALDGVTTNGVCIIGREMPVSYHRSVACCVEWAVAFDADVVIGVGVAVSRDWVTVERTGVQPGPELQADVDGGVTVHLPQSAPDQVQSTVETAQLAHHLNAVVGDDAGRYVCNAWLYQAVQQIDVPVGFLHIPPTGLDAERLRYAIGQMWGEQAWQPNLTT